MNSNDFFIAYLLSKYWGWVLVILLIIFAFSDLKVGLCILGGGIVFFIIVFLGAKEERVRKVQSKEVWDAMSEEEKAIWEEIYTMNPNGGNSYVNGKDAFDKKFKSEFTMVDSFEKKFDRKVPFPKDSMYWGYEYTPKGKELLKAWNQKQEELAQKENENIRVL